MDLIETLSLAARGDRPPAIDVADAVIARLARRPAALARPLWRVAGWSAVAAAALVATAVVVPTPADPAGPDPQAALFPPLSFGAP